LGLVSSYQNLPSEANTSSLSIPTVRFDETSSRAAIYASISSRTTNLMISCIFCHKLAVRIGVVYLLSGFGGSVLSSLFIRNNISVGASGALFGLLGAMLSELITNWSIYTNKVSGVCTLFGILVLCHCSKLRTIFWLSITVSQP
jgi:hypothetical protein